MRESIKKPYIYWEVPTTEEIREVVRLGGRMTATEIADYVGLPVKQSDGKNSSRSRTVRKWIGGHSPIPYSIWCMLCHKAGMPPFWLGDND